MPLAEYRDLYWYKDGTIAAGEEAYVFPLHSNIPASLFADAAGAEQLPNPAVTDAEGYLHFWAEAGHYWVNIDSESFKVAVGVAEEYVTEEDLTAAIDTYNTQTTSVHGIADTALLETQAGAQAKANTARGEAVATAAADATAKADAAQAAAEQTAAGALAGHEAETTNVHGIPDTATLETTSGAQAKADAAQAHAERAAAEALAGHANATTEVHGIADTSALLTSADLDGYATDAELAAHTTATTQVHGIADTAALETKSGAQTKANAAQAAAEATAASTYIAKTARGAASGVAALDASSLIPADQVPWEHVWQPSDLGLKAWVCDPANAQSTGQYPGSGPMRMAAVVLRRTTTVSRIVWHFTGYAGGLQTGSWAGIYRASDGAKVGTVADLSAAASEPAEQHGPGGGTSSSPLDEGTVSLTAGVYYVAWRMVYNTTTQDGPMMLALENAAGAPPNVFGMGGVRRFGYTAAPGATVPTTIPAMENGANRFWVALA